MEATPLTLTLLALLAVSPGLADSPPLVSDRPDFTESAVTIPKGRIQLEGGATSERSDGADAIAAGELLARIGLTDRWELRLGAGSWEEIDPDVGEDESGFGDPFLGAKLRCNDPTSEGIAVAVMFGTFLAAGDDDIGGPDEQPFVNFAASRELTAALSLAGNAGYARASDSGSRFDQVHASLSLGIGLTDRVGAFVEGYGFTREESGGDESTYADAGITWLVSPDFQLDVRAGSGLAGNDVDFFAGLGFVKRW
jgi:hypothetical protein